MSYISNTLADGEDILAEARFHWTYTLGALAGLAIWIAVAFAVSYALSLEQLREAGAWTPLASPEWTLRDWAMAVIVAFGALRFFSTMIKKWTTEIAATDRRLVCKRGWIARSTQELPLNRIEEIRLKQGVLGRILGYGKLSVSGTGGDKPIQIPTIDDPLEFRVGIANARAKAGAI